jgi:hypothetical protein
MFPLDMAARGNMEEILRIAKIQEQIETGQSHDPY